MKLVYSAMKNKDLLTFNNWISILKKMPVEPNFFDKFKNLVYIMTYSNKNKNRSESHILAAAIYFILTTYGNKTIPDYILDYISNYDNILNIIVPNDNTIYNDIHYNQNEKDVYYVTNKNMDTTSF